MTGNGPVFRIPFYVPIGRKASRILLASGSLGGLMRELPEASVLLRMLFLKRGSFKASVSKNRSSRSRLRAASRLNAARRPSHTPRLARSEATCAVRSAAASGL